MNTNIEAVYENGVLKLQQPIPPQERPEVQITIHTQPSPLSQAYGIFGRKGGADEAERFALDPELEFPPPAEEP